MLKPDPTTRNYYYKLLIPSLLPRREVEGVISEALLIMNYNLLLYNAASTSAALLLHFCYINCWPILTSCCKTRRKIASLR